MLNVNVSLLIKLGNHNYLIWCGHMESLIIAYSLEGFIDGIIVEPPKFLDSNRSVINSCYSKWIYASIVDEMNIHVSCKGIAFDKWHALEDTFASNAQSCILDL